MNHLIAHDYDLTDATEARAYLVIAARLENGFADALALVLKAQPSQLQVLWEWAIDQYGSVLSKLDQAYLKTIYREQHQIWLALYSESYTQTYGGNVDNSPSDSLDENETELKPALWTQLVNVLKARVVQLTLSHETSVLEKQAPVVSAVAESLPVMADHVVESVSMPNYETLSGACLWPGCPGLYIPQGAGQWVCQLDSMHQARRQGQTLMRYLTPTGPVHTSLRAWSENRVRQLSGPESKPVNAESQNPVELPAEALLDLPETLPVTESDSIAQDRQDPDYDTLTGPCLWFGCQGSYQPLGNGAWECNANAQHKAKLTQEHGPLFLRYHTPAGPVHTSFRAWQAGESPQLDLKEALAEAPKPKKERKPRAKKTVKPAEQVQDLTLPNESETQQKPDRLIALNQLIEKAESDLNIWNEDKALDQRLTDLRSRRDAVYGALVEKSELLERYQDDQLIAQADQLADELKGLESAIRDLVVQIQTLRNQSSFVLAKPAEANLEEWRQERDRLTLPDEADLHQARLALLVVLRKRRESLMDTTFFQLTPVGEAAVHALTEPATTDLPAEALRLLALIKPEKSVFDIILDALPKGSPLEWQFISEPREDMPACQLCQTDEGRMRHIAPRGWVCTADSRHRFWLTGDGMAVWQGMGLITPPEWAKPCAWSELSAHYAHLDPPPPEPPKEPKPKKERKSKKKQPEVLDAA